MKRLPFALALTLVIALSATAIARAPNPPAPPGNAYGAYGCCCPWSAHLGICPVSPGALLSSFDDVCEIRDADDNFIRYCNAGEEGVYPYRGMTLREIALLFYEFGVLREPTVAGLLDVLCRYGAD